MKTKVQAQRKFAQGAYVPVTSVVLERRTLEPPTGHEVNVINHNTSAKRMLDSIAFSNPGMHTHSPRVVLQRLQNTSSPKVIQKQKIIKMKSKKTLVQNKPTRILRSTRPSSSETNNSDDDRPLTYHLSKGKETVTNGNAVRTRKSSERFELQQRKKRLLDLKKRKRPSVQAQKNKIVSKKRKDQQAKKIAGRGTNHVRNDERPLMSKSTRRLSISTSTRRISTAISPSTRQLSTSTRKLPVSAPTSTRKLTTATSPSTRQLTISTSTRRLTASSSTRRTSLCTSTSTRKMSSSIAPSARQLTLSTSKLTRQLSPTTSPPASTRRTSISTSMATLFPHQIKTESGLDRKKRKLLAAQVPKSNAEDLPINGQEATETVNLKDHLATTSDRKEHNLKAVNLKYHLATTSGPRVLPKLKAVNLKYNLPSSDRKEHKLKAENLKDLATTSDRKEHKIKAGKEQILREKETDKNVSSMPLIPIQSTQGEIKLAPIYYPTNEEFSDPLEYYKKIAKEASKYGLCKVVAPAQFKPQCKTEGLERVNAGSQYPARFYKRWGQGTRELVAIQTYLATHNVFFSRPPLVDGLELNLPKMFRIVQKHGGFKEVSRKKKWTKVAEDMNFIKLSNPEKKLDLIYLKYILPYAILTNMERKSLTRKVEDRWQAKYAKLQRRANNPLHMRKVYLNESAESSDESELSEDERNLRKAILEVEECVKPGRQLTLAVYEKVNNMATQMYFPAGAPTLEEFESVYWKTVLEATDHICVYTASVDTSQNGCGFTTDPHDPISKHGWNLKNVRNNNANILRSLGAVISTTVPILHLGMVFATNCWHRDPHGLPWMDYLHVGPEKIWYGIPDSQSDKFRRAVERLCPTSVQNKTVWLPSDITMIPPNLLLNEGVSLTKITQKPGEFIFIFPKAYSSSICTGYTITESVYFAVEPWQTTLNQVFKELRDNCEPMMFAPEQLLIALARDERVKPEFLRQMLPTLVSVLQEELDSRYKLLERGILEIFVGRSRGDRPYSVNLDAECDVCRRPLYLSKVRVKVYHKSLTQICPQDAYRILACMDGEKKNKIDLILEIFTLASELRRIISTGQRRVSNS